MYEGVRSLSVCVVCTQIFTHVSCFAALCCLSVYVFVCDSLYRRLANAAAVRRVTERRIQLAVHKALACCRSFIVHAGLARLYKVNFNSFV